MQEKNRLWAQRDLDMYVPADCIGPFDKLRAGSSRQKEAAQDENSYWE